MKTSLAIVTALLVGASATGASALVAPYYGADVLTNVTNGVIADLGLSPSTAYVAGGSATGQAAMVAKGQAATPMSSMLSSGGNLCTFNGTKGSGASNASGVVVALDAVDVLAASSVVDNANCNGTADNTGTGLAYSGTSGVFTTITAQNWKWVLALVYGGKDYSTGVVDCNQASRKSLVNNWSNLFQDSGTCANGNATCQSLAQYSNTAGTGTTTPLWHAYRMNEAAGTASVFASLLGLTPSQSQSSVNGFGASPWCNSLNWDVTSDTTGTCALGNHDQFSGPGGIIDPLSKCTIASPPVCGAAGTGNHRMPPIVPAAWNGNNGGVWGLNPNVTKAACNKQTADPTQCIYDVLPTDMQDNDPIRRPCQGNTTNNKNLPGEEVCNLDGALGLVLSIPFTDFIGRAPPAGLGQEQYPTNKCNTFFFGNAPNVFTCAPANLFHSGECPNGDALFGGICLIPADSQHAGHAQCVSSPVTVASIQVLSNLGVAAGNPGNPDGRAYNLHMYNQGADGAVGYTEEIIQNVVSGVSSPISLDFVGGAGRIHQVQSQLGASAFGCQELSVTDQIGCLAQADPCSIGVTGDGAKTWNARPDGSVTGVSTTGASGTDSIRVAQVYPTSTTVNLLGQAGEYELGRKLYFSSLVGFANVDSFVLTTGAADPDELSIGEFESTYANTAALLAADGYFQVENGPLGNAPFCEDFNEGTVCAGTNAQNACTTNVGLTGHGGTVPGEPVSATSLTAPTQSTVCGNGKIEAYEECDNGTSNGASGNFCSVTCRCAGVKSYVPGGTPVCQ